MGGRDLTRGLRDRRSGGAAWDVGVKLGLAGARGRSGARAKTRRGGQQTRLGGTRACWQFRISKKTTKMRGKKIRHSTRVDSRNRRVAFGVKAFLESCTGHETETKGMELVRRSSSKHCSSVTTRRTLHGDCYSSSE